MRLTLTQLEPEFLEQAAPVVKNAQKLERRAEAADAVFEMCVHRACCISRPQRAGVPRLTWQQASCTEQNARLLVCFHFPGTRSVSWTFQPRVQSRLPRWRRRPPQRTSLARTMAIPLPRGSAKSNGKSKQRCLQYIRQQAARPQSRLESGGSSSAATFAITDCAKSTGFPPHRSAKNARNASSWPICPPLAARASTQCQCPAG